MYAAINFKTKKALKEAVEAGRLTRSHFYQPAGLGPDAPEDGKIYVEGPHYPEPHRWYAEVFFADGKAVRVK